MQTYIALFRGINVGGKTVLPMRDLVAVLEGVGAKNVRTYVQSGNAVFQIEETNAKSLSDQISAAIAESHGFEPRVMLLDSDRLRKTISANPFPEAESEPKTLHAYFFASEPESPDLEAMDKIKAESERFALGETALYLHTPDGFGRSKLATRAEKLLGVPATARNWRTVCKIMELVERDAG